MLSYVLLCIDLNLLIMCRLSHMQTISSGRGYQRARSKLCATENQSSSVVSA